MSGIIIGVLIFYIAIDEDTDIIVIKSETQVEQQPMNKD